MLCRIFKKSSPDPVKTSKTDQLSTLEVFNVLHLYDIKHANHFIFPSMIDCFETPFDFVSLLSLAVLSCCLSFEYAAALPARQLSYYDFDHAFILTAFYMVSYLPNSQNCRIWLGCDAEPSNCNTFRRRGSNFRFKRFFSFLGSTIPMDLFLSEQ